MVDFGKFNLLDIRRHTMSKTFSIKTTKSQNDQCTDGFKVSSSFYTEKTLVEEDKALLIGNGLKLRILDENASPYTFNKYAEYADFTSDMLIYEKTYTAELSSTPGTPIAATPFSAGKGNVFRLLLIFPFSLITVIFSRPSFLYAVSIHQR